MNVTPPSLSESVALHQAGQVSTAVQGYAALLENDPNHADAWHLSGVAAMQAGRLDDAIHHLRKAIELRADCPEFLTNLATAYALKGDLIRAERSATEALRIAPNFPLAHFRHAKIQAGFGRTDEALHHFQQALDLGFDPATTLLEAAVVYRSVGNMCQCAKALQQAAQLAEDPIAALCQLANLASQGYYGLSPSELQQLLAAVREGTEHEAHSKRAARAAFAVGAVMEYAGHYTQAFELFTAGNHLTQRYLCQSHSPNWLADRQWYANRLQTSFSAEQIQATRDLGHASDRPIFVVGFPRSGTTLVAQILSAHSHVGSAGELNTLSRMASRASLRCADDQSSPALPYDQLAQLATHYLEELNAYDRHSARVVDKMPGNSLILGLIHTIFPQATLIWCRRDPRDVAVSCFGIMFEDDRLQFETSRLDWLVSSLNLNFAMREYWHSALPGKIHEVHYEQLTSHPEQEIRRLLQACGLPWEESCLTPESQPSVVRTASSVQVRRPIHRQSQRRWERFRPSVEAAFQELRELNG